MILIFLNYNRNTNKLILQNSISKKVWDFAKLELENQPDLHLPIVTKSGGCQLVAEKLNRAIH